MRRVIFSLVSMLFYAVIFALPDDAVIAGYQLWYDGDYSKMTEGSMGNNAVDSLMLTLDVKEQKQGVHSLSYRFVDNTGMWSAVSSATYMVVPKIEIGTVTEAEYWIDRDYAKTTKVSSTDTVATFVVDASALGEGMHTLTCRVKDSKGMYSAAQTWDFLKTVFTPKDSVSAIEYWVDSLYTNRVTLPACDGENIFSVDASALGEGMHVLSYRAISGNGCYSGTGLWAFYKNGTEQKATAIKWFRYWWNDRIDLTIESEVTSEDGVCELNQQLTIPDYARTGYNGMPLMARLNILFGDDAGNISALTYADVAFPDVNAPITTISADKRAAYTSVTISWDGTDEELKDYNVYVSENGMPYILWLPNTTATEAEFKGEPGKTYRFTVTARDKSGNIERFDPEKCATVKFNK